MYIIFSGDRMTFDQSGVNGHFIVHEVVNMMHFWEYTTSSSFHNVLKQEI